MKNLNRKMAGVFTISMLMLLACKDKTTKPNQEVKKPAIRNTITVKTVKEQFMAMRSTFDTLIPIFDGLFITYSNCDTAKLNSLSSFDHGNLKIYTGINPKHQKWGVIDSTGKIVVPFVGDGINTISGHKGVISVGVFSEGMNTNIMRYKYYGTCYTFSKLGLNQQEREAFDLRIIWYPYHQPKYVIDFGHAFYLPKKYRKKSIYHDE